MLMAHSGTTLLAVLFWTRTEQKGIVHTVPQNCSGAVRMILSCQCERYIRDLFSLLAEDLVLKNNLKTSILNACMSHSEIHG